MSASKKSLVLFIPPTMRFLTELSTWIWLLLSAIFVCYGFGILLAISLTSLGFLNFPGDKRSADSKNIGLSVPGWTRVGVEILSAAMGLVGAYYFGEYMYSWMVVFLPQLGITLISFYLDFKRWLWMLGRRDQTPEYVTVVHKDSKKSS